MINTLLLDWGGVLMDAPFPSLTSHLGDKLGVGAETFLEAFLQSETEFITGRLPEEGLWQQVCSYLEGKGHAITRPTEPLWADAIYGYMAEKTEMIEIARGLHNDGYKIGLLSNSERPTVERFPGLGYDFFDALVFSCIEGIRKPDPRIYLIALEQLSAEPQETVFIDDIPKYLPVAQGLGIHTILYERTGQVIDCLQGLGVRVPAASLAERVALG